jgi:hypothetical protein
MPACRSCRPMECTICQPRPPCVCHKLKLPGLPHCFGTDGTMWQLPRSFEGLVRLRKRPVCAACLLLRGREQRTFGPLGARRFHSVNRRRNSFHRVALATLEHAVLESSDAGVYTLQVHAYPTRRAARTFSRQQLRQSACAHRCTPRELHQRPNVNQKRCRRLHGRRHDSNFGEPIQNQFASSSSLRQLRRDRETGHLEHKIGNASKRGPSHLVFRTMPALRISQASSRIHDPTALC